MERPTQDSSSMVRTVLLSFLENRDRVREMEGQIDAALGEYVTDHLNPYSREWPRQFHCLSYRLVENSDSLVVEGVWTSGYLGDEGERDVQDVPIEVLTFLGNPPPPAPE